jgi:uncharacterized membrane protein YgdD (TMEM256/DUF423 family)
MNKTFLITAAIIGALSVALGAFGAHGLKDKLNEYTLGIFETACALPVLSRVCVGNSWVIVSILQQRLDAMERKIIYCRHDFVLRFVVSAHLFYCKQ